MLWMGWSFFSAREYTSTKEKILCQTVNMEKNSVPGEGMYKIISVPRWGCKKILCRQRVNFIKPLAHIHLACTACTYMQCIKLHCVRLKCGLTTYRNTRVDRASPAFLFILWTEVFGRRLNSNQAKICVLGFTANRVWLVSRFIILASFDRIGPV